MKTKEKAIMVSIEFHHRPSRRGRGYLGSVLVRVIARRRSASLTLPYRLYESEWDGCLRKVFLEGVSLERQQYVMDVVLQLEKDRLLLEKIRRELEVLGEESARVLLSVFKMRRFKSGLSGMVAVLSKELEEKGQIRTARAYRSALRAVLCFSKKEDLSVGEITEGFLSGFQYYLESHGRSLNTISFYMRNLRAIYNKCTLKGWIRGSREGLFKNVYTSVAPSLKRALSLEDMKRLENLRDDMDLLNESEKEALNLFLFSFHGRGISFVDMAYLKKEDIKKDRISYKRRKTGTQLHIRVSGKMHTFLSFFKDKTKDSPYLFPLISPLRSSSYHAYEDALKRQNRLLQQIAQKIGLPSLTTHMARHSWATIAKKKDVPLWVISESLGHRSVKTTYIYLDSFGSEVLDKAALKVSRAVTGRPC